MKETENVKQIFKMFSTLRRFFTALWKKRLWKNQTLSVFLFR